MMANLHVFQFCLQTIRHSRVVEYELEETLNKSECTEVLKQELCFVIFGD